MQFDKFDVGSHVSSECGDPFLRHVVKDHIDGRPYVDTEAFGQDEQYFATQYAQPQVDVHVEKCSRECPHCVIFPSNFVLRKAAECFKMSNFTK